MYDLNKIILGFLFLYLLLGNNFLGDAISEDLQRVLKENTIIKLGIVFLTIFIFIVLSYFDKGKQKSPLHLLTISTIIFLIYLMSIKAKGKTIIIICVLFFIIYLLEISRRYYYKNLYNRKLSDVFSESSEEIEHIVFKYLTVIQSVIIFIAVFLLLKDYINYYRRKYH